MCEAHLDAVTAVKDILCDCWAIDDVLDALEATKVLTGYNVEVIRGMTANRDKVNEFVRIFRKKEDSAFSQFLSVLWVKNQKQIVQLIWPGWCT